MKYAGEIRRAVRWLLRSGIQNPAGAPPRTRGGVNAWYDERSGAYPFIYSEVTGYFINLLVFLRRSGAGLGVPAGDLTAGAELAAGWLLRRARDPRTGAFKCRFSAGAGFSPRWLCTFDNAVIANALAGLSAATGDRLCARHAAGCAGYLLRSMLGPGEVRPKRDYATGRIVRKPGAWSLSDSPFQLKALALLLPAAESAGGPRCRQRVLSGVERLVARQDRDGAFRITDRDGRLYFHPVFYALEGLYILLKSGLLGGAERELAARSFKKALDWLFRRADLAPVLSSSVMLAQLLRLAALTGRAGERRGRWAGMLLSFQADGGPAVRGGFRFSLEKPGHINSWGTMMAVQALLLAGGGASLDKEPLRLV